MTIHMYTAKLSLGATDTLNELATLTTRVHDLIPRQHLNFNCHTVR